MAQCPPKIAEKSSDSWADAGSRKGLASPNSQNLTRAQLGLLGRCRSSVTFQMPASPAASLVAGLMSVLKKGASQTEAVLAATSLSLTFVSMAEESGEFIEELLPSLGAQLKGARHAPVRARYCAKNPMPCTLNPVPCTLYH